MITFFCYFLTGRWIKLYRHCTQSAEDKTFQDFENNPSMVVTVRPRLGYNFKAYQRSFKKLTKGVIKSPFNLKLWPDMYSEENGPHYYNFNNMSWIKDHFSEDSTLQGVVISKKMYDKLEIEGSLGYITFGSLSIYRSNSWCVRESGFNVLKSLLTEVWLKVAKKKGNLPNICTNCDADFNVNIEEMSCFECSVDVEDVCKIPKKISDMYLEISEYEDKKDVIFLEKVS